ncbi:MBOAT, membrane-bound O-acyltransferase family-domain-containing protein [Halteromyces radiatus]|uniref:MBOAT, membrane-bound O-acyltransferase family-domain-containing protein n=1 Tax=Halteromyces radiatus TaxID=101107 RepID=UPI00221FAA00|nr:MBOAT, membrane-bound O-acyltransferase family-domain-containing protein [Halteromyces radiatus]KAI8088853.1 MBOAT, membrane-bound O-acyltransferase family-domain-containing protein [Halteromyces radiatus]
MLYPISYSIYWLTGIPESTARLLLTVILGYVAAFYYDKLYIHHPNDKINQSKYQPTASDRNTFILITGLLLSVSFSGWTVIHSLVTTALSYGICLFVGESLQNRVAACALVWVTNAIYLLGGYYYMATDEYDISWTMPQCILCLRLMGFGFDYMDGGNKVNSKPGTTVSNNSLPMSFDIDTPLYTLPPFEQVMAYCYFPAAFLVGPQFSFSLYRRWVDNPNFLGKTVTDWDETYKAQRRYMVRCLLLAIFYLGMQQLVGASYPSSYLLTSEYQQLPFLRRCWTFLVTGKFIYNKYLGIWLLTEGACALFGITYDGEDEEGNAKFGGLANTLPLQYETATTIDDVIGSFNINTNLWTKYYVFKRLKWFGNKSLSQGASLFFLAVWHGFHFNYFTTFSLEFLYTQCESVLRRHLMPVVTPLISKNSIYRCIWKGLAWMTCSMTLNYAVVGFDLLQTSKAWTAYRSVYFIGHLLIPLILVSDKMLPKKHMVRTNKNKKVE